MRDVPTIVTEARLLKSEPSAVFRELINRPKSKLGSRAETSLERLLLSRQEPLIDLALACTTADKDILHFLYNQGLVEATNELDTHYQLALRVACLSNQDTWDFHFPARIIGESEVSRIVLQGQHEERSALLKNPEVDSSLLVNLYTGAGPFQQLSDDVRRWMVMESAKNPRLCDERDSDDSPDMEYYSIHKAIFQLLESAPVTNSWVYTLFNLLESHFGDP